MNETKQNKTNNASCYQQAIGWGGKWFHPYKEESTSLNIEKHICWEDFNFKYSRLNKKLVSSPI